MKKIFWAELRLLIKNSTALWLFITYLSLSLIVLVVGKQRYNHELQAYEKLEIKYNQDVKKWMEKKNNASPGYIAYYLAQPAFFTPSPWSILFPGERFEKLNLQRVRQLSVHGQIHGNPIRNLEHSLIGHLDFSLLWLYILPLMIGIITVTCIAEEKRLGRWLLLSSIASTKKIILNRMIVKFLIISCIHLCVLFIAQSTLPLPFDITFIKITSILTCYTLLWFLISAIVAFLHLNARQSILIFTIIWISFSWLIPSLHYISKMNSDAYNTGIEFLLDQRQLMNDSWDRDKKSDLAEFLNQHPKWQKTDPLGEKFDWKWYYAMQKNSDNKVKKRVEKYFSQMVNTDSLWSYLSPNLVTQSVLEDLADTSVSDYQLYLQALVNWHGDNQEFWFPYFFFKKEYKSEVLEDLSPFIFHPTNKPFLKVAIYWLLMFLLTTFLLYIIVFMRGKALVNKKLNSF